jgi:hypothetical protein
MAGRTPSPHCGPVAYAPQEQVSPGRAEAESSLRNIPGIEGVGEGRDAIGDPAWVVYVRDRSVAAQLPARIGGRSVVPEVSGEIEILPAR